MPDITSNVSFDKVCREWRCKWTADADKASLVKCQEVLNEVLPTLKGLDGFVSVQRVVCGGCLDFKIMTQLSADKFGAWESAQFAPEADVLSKLKAIEGVSSVETQTMTLMSM